MLSTNMKYRIYEAIYSSNGRAIAGLTFEYKSIDWKKMVSDGYLRINYSESWGSTEEFYLDVTDKLKTELQDITTIKDSLIKMYVMHGNIVTRKEFYNVSGFYVPPYMCYGGDGYIRNLDGGYQFTDKFIREYIGVE